MKKSIRTQALLVLCAIFVLSLLTYARSLSLPFISDDYVQIHYARKYGAFENWPALFNDALYRCRATSLVLTHWTEQLFGIDPMPYRLTSLFLHILCSTLVFALGSWRVIGWRIAALAALCFAFLEGHQEAVIWYAALPELLAVAFVLGTVLTWIRFLKTGSPAVYALCFATYLFALLSKESAVIAVPLIALVAVFNRPPPFWRPLLAAAPFALAAIAYFFWGYEARSTHLHYNDGTFSFSAPFPLTLARSLFRMLWVWGLLSLLVVWRWRFRPSRLTLTAAIAWMALALGPNLFLTYMTQAPSRHTYAASIGLALVVALGLEATRRRFPMRWAMPLAFAIVALQQAGYIWTKKQRQFEERAAPTVEILRKLRENDLTLRLRCFPYGEEVAAYAAWIERRQTIHVVGHPDAGADATFDFCDTHGPSSLGVARATR